MIKPLLLGCCVFLFTGSVFSTEYTLADTDTRVLGEDIQHVVVEGDYFQLLAERYNVGFMALIAANKNVDPFLPPVGQTITIPKKLILPFGYRSGIVVNIAELRLYYFHPETNKVSVFPVGIGKEGFSTPLVSSYISEKRKDPEWRPSQAMRERYYIEHNKPMPRVYPPGPDNPFGKYALRIGASEYLVHGTNKRLGIGMRSSSGCIRLFDDDIAWLYQHVPLNTRIRIINQPIKMAYENKIKRFIEVHQPLSLDNGEHVRLEITDAVKAFAGKDKQVLAQLKEITQQQQGVVTELFR